ncbi:ABC transporter ATP-binding protein [Neobittarella massiliensis]|uniref:ABC transporter ATP-binding protein n=1 Tax=Neobittarella massiliensis (ex Bilen et al. 2018) TaxID=2041842 RepID=UPI000CF72B54|nr:ABC transporter ATP-binding protein [Neobittarella massiliensis]
MGAITIQHIVKNFSRDIQVLKDLELQIEDGSFTVLLGPSGCGKSTLLRIIAGLETPTSGRVLLDGQDITDTEPGQRQLAMVFQNYALYPHMTAEQNVEYGLKIKKVPKEERRRRVQDALAMVELGDQAQKRPAQMSGGQRQRVALARALVKSPKVFLMDEPLSNLDAKLRNQMRVKISQLYRQLGSTFLYVTHDQVEAMSMGTDIVILNQGKIMQRGTPQQIYTDPQNTFVAGFIGSPPCNILPWNRGSVAIRPEEVRTAGTGEPGLTMPAKILSTEQLGDDSIYLLSTPLGQMKMKRPCNWQQQEEEIRILLPAEKLYFFDEQGDRIPSTDTLRQDFSLYLGHCNMASRAVAD